MNHRVWAGLIALALATAPSIASAGEILLAPMVGRNVKSTTLTNITSLIYSELDFNSQVSGVNELSSKPSSLTNSCLSSTSCLKSIARLGGNEDQLLAGYVTTSGGAYVIKMVLFDITGSSIVRTKSFTLGASPEALADGMTNVLKEVLTGRSKTQAVEEETFDFDFGDDDDDFEFEEPSVAEVDDAAERRRAEEDRRRREAEEARQRAEEERRRREAEAQRQREAEEQRRREAEEARRRAEEERRRREAEAQRRREAEEARRRREAQEASRRSEENSGSIDLDAISFGSAAIIVDEEEASAPSISDIDIEEEEFLRAEEDDDLMLLDLDEPEPSRAEKSAREPKVERETPKRTTESRPTLSRTTSRQTANDDPTRFELTARAGYSPYFNLGFITYGAEGAIAVGETGLFVLAGVEAYSVQRAIPEEFQGDSGQSREWNTIFPINAGLSYRLLQGTIQPYIGADAIFAQYYVDTDGGSWAVGARARAGVNLMVNDNFGFNLNAAAGFWSGKNWALIERDVKPSGVLPQISAGTVFSF